MTFTDDDLKKLDDYLMEITYCTCKDNGALCEGCWLAEKYHALINRLKAAEKCIEHSIGHDEDCDEVHNYGRCSCGHEGYYDAWRKEAGK